MDEKKIKDLIEQRRAQLVEAEGKLGQINAIIVSIANEVVGLRASIKELEGLLVNPDKEGRSPSA